MIEGSARGNPNPGVESLSVSELSAWAPDIVKILKQMGVSIEGNEDSSLDFLCEEAGIEKPNKLIFNLSLEKIKLQYKDVIMVGDSFSKDIKGAKELGIKSYLIKSL